MESQENPDHSIAQHLSEGKRFSPLDKGVASALAAVKTLVQLWEIALPPEFAHCLDVSLRARIRHRGGPHIWESFPQQVS